MENVVRASYLNVTKNLTSSMGPQLLLQTSLYARIVKTTHFDLLGQGVWVFTSAQLIGERGKSAKAYVKNDA